MTKELKQSAPRNHGPIQETDLYDFAGWLTTRPGVMSVGRSCEVGPLSEAVAEYIKAYPQRFALTAAQPAQAGEVAQAEFNRAIDFAIREGIGAAIFLDAWRHGDTSEWPEFEANQDAPEPVLFNGLTEAETNASASVMGLAATPTQPAAQDTRTTADTLREIKAASCKDCAATGYTDPGEADSPDGPGRPAVVCGSCSGTGWRDGVHISDQQATPEPSHAAKMLKADVAYVEQQMAAATPEPLTSEQIERHIGYRLPAHSMRLLLELLAPQATPEPVGEPVGRIAKFFNDTEALVEFSEPHAGAPLRAGDALYIRPAPGVPKGYALVGIEVLEAWGKLDEVKAACVYPYTAQAKGVDHG